MRLHYSKLLVLPALMLTGAGFMFSQQPPVTSAQDLRSPEEVLEQLYGRMAAIYRAMAAISTSDSEQLRVLTDQCALLAQEQEKAAAALKSMAAFHQKTTGQPRQPAPAPAVVHVNYGDSAFRR